MDSGRTGPSPDSFAGTCVCWIPAKVARIWHKWPNSGQFRQNLVSQNPAMVAGCSQISVPTEF
jgi:hypothetical protein